MPVKQFRGGTTITGLAIDGFRVRVLISALKLYVEHGILTDRRNNPTHLRAIATYYTGKCYTRNAKGTRQALADMEAFAGSLGLDALGAKVDETTETECDECASTVAHLLTCSKASKVAS